MVPLSVALVLAMAAIVRLSMVLRAMTRESRETDPLTGLMNRAGFEGIVDDHLESSLPFGMVWMDLDGFRQVNEVHGFSGGDKLLREVGPRIRQCLRPGDAVARFGGDQFLIMIREADNVEAVMRRLLTGVDASAGYSVFPDHGGSVPDLLRFAETAMRQAKAKNRGGVVRYEPAMAAAALRGTEIAHLIESALANDHFRLVYQPIVDEQAQIVRMDALVRIDNPELGRVPPVEFIGVSEQTGLIHSVGAWVLRRACLQARQWHDAGHKTQVSINLSPMQIASDYQAEGILQEVRTNGPGPSGIVIHITGMVPAEGPMAKLRAAGIHVTSQQWGVEGPQFDGVRIRAPFVVPPGKGLVAVAQGIEREDQLEQAQAAGCQLFQGFYISPVLETEDATALLRTGMGLPGGGEKLVGE